MQLIIALRNYMLTSNMWIEKERTRTEALRIVTWHFLRTRAHNYVKIAISKEIYTKLTESVQNPRCTSHTTQRAEDRYPPHCSALIHANPQQRMYGIRQQSIRLLSSTYQNRQTQGSKRATTAANPLLTSKQHARRGSLVQRKTYSPPIVQGNDETHLFP